MNVDYTFAELLEGREDDFPTLARAAASIRPAERERIEWLVDTAEGSREVWFNYTQINRSPYSGGEASRAKALDGFLQSIDQTLEFGTPSYEERGAYNLWTCGGYRHYLGRDLVDTDVLVLRVLRGPFLSKHDWNHEGNVPLDTPIYDWLAEFSLEVIPGTLVAA